MCIVSGCSNEHRLFTIKIFIWVLLCGSTFDKEREEEGVRGGWAVSVRKCVLMDMFSNLCI